MEKVALNNVQFDQLAQSQPMLKPYFYGTRPCNRLPTSPNKQQNGKVNQVGIGSRCGPATTPVRSWTVTPYRWKHTRRRLLFYVGWTVHWKRVTQNRQSLQSQYSQSCGDYALFFLIDRSQGKTMNEFLMRFDKHDYVHNDHKSGANVKETDRTREGMESQL